MRSIFVPPLLAVLFLLPPAFGAVEGENETAAEEKRPAVAAEASLANQDQSASLGSDGVGSDPVRFVRRMGTGDLGESGEIDERRARYWYHLTYPTGTLPSRPWDKAREHVRRYVPDAPPWIGERLVGPGVATSETPGRRSVHGEAIVDPGTNVWVEYGPRPLNSDFNGDSSNTSGFHYGITSGRLNVILSDPTDRTGSGGGPPGDRAWLGYASGGLWRLDGIQTACPAGVCDPPQVTTTSLWDDRDLTTQAISALELDPSDPTGDTLYVGTGDWMASDQFSAGIMKTIDGGATWSQIGTGVFTSFSTEVPGGGASRWANQNVREIEVLPSDPDTILVGTRFDFYLTNDGGATWQTCPFGDRYTHPVTGPIDAVNRISWIHLDGGTVYLAVSYPFSNANYDNGVYSFTLPASGCPIWRDDEGDPLGDPAFGSCTGTTCGDFTVHNAGLPALVNRGRIEVAATGSGAGLLLYAQIQDADIAGNVDAEGTFALKPNDGSWAGTWRQITSGPTAWKMCDGTTNATTDQDWYDLHVAVDPTDDKHLYVGHVDLFEATVNANYDGLTSLASNLTNVYGNGSGGRPSCPEYGEVHPDQHSFAFVEGSAGQWILVGNDGGIYVNTGGGALASWYRLSGAGSGLSTNQFYAGQVGMNFAGVGGSYGNPVDNRQWLLGGMQDNGCASWDSSTTDATWVARGWGGDGMWTAFDSLGATETSGLWLTESQGGNINCSATGADGPVGACSPTWAGNRNIFGQCTSMGLPGCESPDWSTPLFMDQYHCTDVRCQNKVAAGDHVYASTDYDASPNWTRTTGSLTAGLSGRSDDGDGEGYADGSVVSIHMARSSATSVVAGTDNGRLWWSGNVFSCSGTANQSGFSCNPNGSASWEAIDAANATLPNRVISGVAFAPDTGQVVYAAVNGFGVNTPSTPGHVFRAVRTGANSWTVSDKSGNLPDVPFETVAVNPYNPNQVFAGGHFGFYYTDDVTVASPSWVRYMEGPLPNAPIFHFSLDRGPQTAPLDSTTLAAFTYGRGVYAIKLPGAGESFCTGANAPTNPDNLAVSATVANRLDLTWDPSPTAGVTDYRVFRSTSPGGPYTLVGSTGGSTSFLDAGLSGGTTYYYVVRAVKGGCESDESTEASGTPFGDCTLAPTFAGVQTVSELGGGQGCGLRIGWNAGASNCGGNLVYNVYRSTTSGFTPGAGSLLASCVAGTSFDDTTLAADTAHYYVVRAEDAGSVGSGSCGVGTEDGNAVYGSGLVSPTGTVTLMSESFDALLAGEYPAGWTNASFGGGSDWQGARACSGQSAPNVLRYGSASSCTGNTTSSTDGIVFVGPLAIPAGASGVEWLFHHRFAWGNSDGGILFVSNDANFTTFYSVDGAYLSGAGYTGTAKSLAAFTGTSTGNPGSMVQTTVDLSQFCTDNVGNGFVAHCAGDSLYLAWNGYTNAGNNGPGWFVDDVVLRYPGGSSCTPAPNPVQFLTATGKSTECTFEWLNPDAGNYASTLLRTDPSAYPADPTAGALLVDQNDGLGNHGTTTLSGLTNGEDYFVSTFVDGGGAHSARRVVTGYPVDTSDNLKWNLSTEEAALATPIQWSGIGVYAASNTRELHAMSGGAAGGTWPAGWEPMVMNAPAQSQPLVLPSAWSGLAHDAVFVSSQDGYLYCVNAATGAGCTGWTNGRSASSFGMLQATPILYYGTTGTTNGARWLLVGSRDSSGAVHGLHAVNAADGATAWSFANASGAQGGNDEAIGIVSGAALAHPANEQVFFASRARAGGSANTIWALDLSSGAPVLDWALALGDTDSGVTRDWSRDRILFGTNAGWVYSYPAAGGAGVGRDFDDGAVKEFVSYDADRDRLLFATETGVHSLTADTSQWATTPQIEEITGLDSPTRPLLHFGTSRIYFGACATTCANGRLYEIDLAVPATWSAPTTYDVPGVGGLGSVIIDRSQSPALLHAGSRSGRIVAIEIPL